MSKHSMLIQWSEEDKAYIAIVSELPGLSAFGSSQEEAVKDVSLSEDLLPLFVRSCGACHKRERGNEAAVEHETYYETGEDILGKVGKHIIAGKPEESGLVKVLNQSQPVSEHKIVMPPPESEIMKWNDEEVALFEKWIKDGAKDN